MACQPGAQCLATRAQAQLDAGAGVVQRLDALDDGMESVAIADVSWLGQGKRHVTHRNTQAQALTGAGIEPGDAQCLSILEGQPSQGVVSIVRLHVGCDDRGCIESAQVIGEIEAVEQDVQAALGEYLALVEQDQVVGDGGEFVEQGFLRASTAIGLGRLCRLCRFRYISWYIRLRSRLSAGNC